jgi:hypothetical protein
MTINEALQNKPIRLTNDADRRYLIGAAGKWQVRRQIDLTRAETLIETTDEQEAVRVLMEGK